MPTLTLSEIARLCGASVEGDGSRVVSGPAALRDAEAEHVSFCAHPRYRRELQRTRAAGVVVPPALEVAGRADLTLLRCSDPSRAFTEIVRAFALPAARPDPGIHPSAVVHPTAEIGDGASIGPLCTVAEGARVGARAVLHAQVAIGARAGVGADTELFPMVVLYRDVRVGERCVIHAGCVLGADGYGFDPTPAGWEKIPQVGTVVIEDDVEIGANTTIDRGRFGATRVGSGAKLDNLVHLAHNVVVGERAMIAAQTGIAGSARLGPGVLIGGQVGVAGHAEIGSGARVAAQSGVFGDVAPGTEVLGYPARPRAEALRMIAQAGRVPDLLQRLKQLEARVLELEGMNTAVEREGAR